MDIAVSSWSFHAALYAGKLRLADVPFRVFDLGYRAVELQDIFLWPKPPGRLARMLGGQPEPIDPHHYDRKALLGVRLNRLRSGTRLVCWTIDSDLTVEDQTERGAQRAYLGGAIETARFLSAPLIRITSGGDANDRSALDRAVSLIGSALPVAIAAGIKLAVENHGGLSGDPDVLVELVERCRGHQPKDVRSNAWPATHLGVCLDLGNFAAGEARAGMQKLAPYAIHVHAKSRAFDAAGEETSIDYQICLSALKSAGYDGAISIEYEGEGDVATGINRTRDLIEKYW